jgi:chemotaxis protein methyltransferase CheR
MNASPLEPLLARFSGLVADRLGLHFGPERRADLVRGLEEARRELGFADVATCLQWLTLAAWTRQQVDVLARHLTVGETYFFRDPRGLEVLEAEILPRLIAARRRSTRLLRVWSAGCASGEEAYTLAILLVRAIPDWTSWAITVLGTDLNPLALQKAAEGVYSEWSFRDAPRWLKDGYFQPLGRDRYRLRPEIRKLVSWAPLNLATDPYPSLTNNTNGLDVIVCRNVVMYFSPEQAGKVMSQLARCLVDDGWLLGSPTESLYLSAGGLVPVVFPGAVLYRRSGGESAAPRPGAALTPAGSSRGPSSRGRSALAARTPPAAPAGPSAAAASGPAARPARGPAAADRRESAFEQALDHHRHGRYREAAAALEPLAAADPEQAPIVELLTRIYADQGQLQEALRWNDRALAADRLNPLHHYLRATILEEQGDWDQAASSLNRALYLDRDFVLAHFALGSLARRRGRPGPARRHLAQALELLAAYPAEAIVPASEGLTAGRLREIIKAMTAQEAGG